MVYINMLENVNYKRYTELSNLKILLSLIFLVTNNITIKLSII